MTREECNAKRRAYYAACRSFILARRAVRRAAMSEEEKARERTRRISARRAAMNEEERVLYDARRAARARRAAMSEDERRREYNERQRAYYAANREKYRKASARRAAKFRSTHLDEVRAKHREACRRANAARRSPHEQLLCLGIID